MKLPRDDRAADRRERRDQQDHHQRVRFGHWVRRGAVATGHHHRWVERVHSITFAPPNSGRRYESAQRPSSSCEVSAPSAHDPAQQVIAFRCRGTIRAPDPLERVPQLVQLALVQLAVVAAPAAYDAYAVPWLARSASEKDGLLLKIARER